MSLDFSLEVPGTVVVFDSNITHNLNRMAEEAGIYQALWRPDDHPEFRTAGDLVPVLQAGYDALRADPERFKPFDAKNGWGTYEQFLPWVRNVLAACMEHPEALVRVSR